VDQQVLPVFLRQPLARLGVDVAEERRVVPIRRGERLREDDLAHGVQPARVVLLGLRRGRAAGYVWPGAGKAVVGDSAEDERVARVDEVALVRAHLVVETCADEAHVVVRPGRVAVERDPLGQYQLPHGGAISWLAFRTGVEWARSKSTDRRLRPRARCSG